MTQNSFLQKIKKLFSFKTFKEIQTARAEKYLAQSVDLADLERRQRDLERRIERAKLYYI